MTRCNRQQEQFVENLVSGMDGRSAAKAAGYTSPKACYTLMAKSHVKALLAERTVQRAKQNGELSLDWLINESIKGVIKPLRKTQLSALRMAAILLRRKEAAEAKAKAAE